MGPIQKAWKLLNHATSPEALRHKVEYDTEYESNPERVEYREDLNRERKKRGIYGEGGPDMSHTKEHTLVAEDPHTNRARHFKERGTLKSKVNKMNEEKIKKQTPNHFGQVQCLSPSCPYPYGTTSTDQASTCPQKFVRSSCAGKNL